MSSQPSIEGIASRQEAAPEASRVSEKFKGVVCPKPDCTNYGDFSNCYMFSHCGDKCRKYARPSKPLPE